jgi:isoleucyl-tRNA synthetase
VQALATTAHVLRESATLLAPFAPFFAEWLWRDVRSPEDAESVHLCTWNDAHDLAESDHQVLSDMQEVRNVVSLALEQRAKAGIPVRQPLARLGLVSGGREFSPELIELIKDEVNVKEIARIAGLPEGFAVELDTAITPELREEGMVREIIRAIQAARKDAGLQPGQQARAKLSSSEPLLCAAAQKYTTQISATTSLESLAIEQGDTGLSISLL